jgi:hypothetical protein
MKEYEYIDGVKILSNCPICDSRYHANEMRVIEENSNGHLLHIRCHKCKSCVIAVVISNNMGVNSVTLITDLGSSDFVKFKNSDPISVNDILDLHSGLIGDNKLNYQSINM